MTEYVEPTLRTRQLFFLAVILLAGLSLFAFRLDVYFPPVSDWHQMQQRLFVVIVLSNLLNIALSIWVINLTRRAVRCGQWPPKGMRVPFRTKIKRIKKPRIAWLFLTVFLCVFTLNTLLPWFGYAMNEKIYLIQEQYEEFKEEYEELKEKHEVSEKLGSNRN